MNVEIDQARRDDEAAGVDLFDLGLRNLAIGFAGDAAIDDEEIGGFIAAIGGIDDASVANDKSGGGHGGNDE